MNKTHAFAILAPVPEMHLVSGLDAIAAQLDSDELSPGQLPKIALGSMDFELFGEAEPLRAGKAVDVFIYASHSQAEQPLNPAVTWQGVYIGYVGSRRGRYPGKAMFRPPSTASDSPVWAVFWEVQQLEPLKTPIPIGNLRGRNKKANYPPRFMPEGPMLIEHPLVKRAGTSR